VSLWSRLERRITDLAGELLLDEFRDQVAQARQLLAAGDPYAAIDVLEAMLLDKPDHGQALILLGAARLAVRKPAAALTAFEDALKVRPGDPDALIGHGQTLVALGHWQAALTSLTRAVAEAAGDRGRLAEAYQAMGMAWRRIGDTDKAIRELRKAVAEAPADADARAALGEALLVDLGHPTDEIRRHLDKAIEAEPGPPVAYLALGRVALADAAPATAAGHFARARALLGEDDTPLGKELRIEALLGEGDAALAERDAPRAHLRYLEALQLDPRRAYVHARIAETQRAIGDHAAAIASYDRALALGGGKEILRAAITTANRVGDPARQVRWGNDLLALDPDDTDALVARGLGTLAQGDPAGARVLLDIAAGRGSPDALVGLAKIALATCDGEAGASVSMPGEAGPPSGLVCEPDRAVDLARAVLRATPEHAGGREVLALAHRAAVALPADGGDIARLAHALERVVSRERSLAHLVGDTARAAAELDQPLLVTVMGEFSSGKSSFVNAFIGADVAPTGITPTTATINVVRYGRERGGRIIARGGDPAIPPLELGWDALFAHLRALTPEAARDIERVEILLPLPQLEKVNIVDTPGLNSIQPEHEETARAFIARADAVVWVFTAGQGGKASEKKALASIRAEGKRVLGVLNKRDQLSAAEVDEVVAFIGQTLGELVEAVVPFSARDALAWKTTGAEPDGNARGLEAALEERFFTQARQLKRDACARRLRAVIAVARERIEARAARASEAATTARAASDALADATIELIDKVVATERRTLAEAGTALYRRAAREVLELVQPRRLPFSQHSATVADRDYLISLLDSGFEAFLAEGRRRVGELLAARWKDAAPATAALAAVIGADVESDLARVATDRTQLALAQIFDRARAYLRGYLDGGSIDAFFRNDVPRLQLEEDAVYHALIRGAPDLDRELAVPLARAGSDAIAAVAARLDHWAGVADVLAYDLDVSLLRNLDELSAFLA
jgi:tetratricopeptide (TPR) repeat protein/GTPase SAR1 family protein